MKIVRLQLKYYKRLLLNNIQYIDYKPENKIQLILGTNGSGKSSLLKELSPLPANKIEYEKGGYKEIEILHKGSRYVLKSDFNDKPIFSFIKNEEELNQGYTVSVYKQLVKSEFNIDNDVHDMLLGQYRFHDMSSLERRNWFTKISSCDYSYAINYYQRLREELRDAQGAIKTIQSRIVTESEKMLDEKKEQEIRKDLIVLNEYLNFILDNKPNVNNDSYKINNDIAEIELNIKKHIDEIKKLRKVFLNTECFESEEDIDDAIVKYRSNILSLENSFNYLCQKIDEESKIEQAYITSNINSVDEINIAVKDIMENISIEEKKKNKCLYFSNASQALTAVQTINEQLIYIANNIPKDDRYTFSREEIINGKTKLDFIVNKLKEYSDAQDIVIQKKKELEHYKGHDKTECPACGHKWFKGFDENIYNGILKTLENNSENINNLNKQKDELVNYLDLAREYMRIMNMYLSVTNSWSILDSLFSHLNNESIITKFPEKLNYILIEVEQDLKIDLVIENLKNKLIELDKLKKNINVTQENNLDKIKETILNLNKELHKVNLNLDISRKYLNKLLYYKNMIKIVNESTNTINQLLDSRNKQLNEKLLTKKRDGINDIIRLTRIEISAREQLISNINIQKAIVNDLNSQLQQNIKKFELLKIAVRKLSPNEGLIAKGLTGFINHFILELNIFIKKIWLYPLCILPIVIDDDNQLELNYDFKVKVNDNNIIPDISKTSSAMKEVIDLAFKVISMKYLGLSESPIYLDEFAASFDKEHRHKAYTVINNLINSDNFSQIFTVSHYEDCYGSFTNTDITILCGNNIPLPKDNVFNKVIILS